MSILISLLPFVDVGWLTVQTPGPAPHLVIATVDYIAMFGAEAMALSKNFVGFSPTLRT